jgi:pimeloyl-ACP methyl ester carboxylesterase
MKYVWLTLGWFFSVFLGLLFLSMLLLKNWIHALILFFIILLILPPFSTFVKNRFHRPVHPLFRGFLIVGLLFIFFILLLGTGANSIYKTPEIKTRFIELYNEKMTGWPVPYDNVFIETKYGKVHVIVSGTETAPPLLLLHASGVASWSWKYNIQDLGQYYRCYAIDLIGDAGKSEFTTLENILKTGRDQADLYTEITGKLGVDKAFVAGASEGGFIGTNYALYYPERVEKLALLGPMGYSGATQSVIRILFAQLFPLKPIQESTFSWAFSNNPKLKNEFNEWFPLLMSECTPIKVMPLPFSAEERKQLKIAVLFIFGERDNLVGDPGEARSLVQDMQNVRVEIVNAGHLMAAEIPEQINSLLIDFFTVNTNNFKLIK